MTFKYHAPVEHSIQSRSMPHIFIVQLFGKYLYTSLHVHVMHAVHPEGYVGAVHRKFQVEDTCIAQNISA